MAASADDAYGDAGAPQYGIKPGDPLVMVADVVAVPPTKVLDGSRGRERQAARRPADRRRARRGGASAEVRAAPDPQAEEAGRGAARVGTGPEARPDSLITIDYLGQLWKSRTRGRLDVRQGPTTVSLGTGNVIKAWDRALVGVPRGSRVLVLAPPSLAFQSTGQPPTIPTRTATLAYVIDVLGVQLAR